MSRITVNRKRLAQNKCCVMHVHVVSRMYMLCFAFTGWPVNARMAFPGLDSNSVVTRSKMRFTGCLAFYRFVTRLQVV